MSLKNRPENMAAKNTAAKNTDSKNIMPEK